MELALASNAPETVKAAALLALSAILTSPSANTFFRTALVRPIVPSPTSASEGFPAFDRLPEQSAPLALVGSVIFADSFARRAASMQAFQAFVLSAPATSQHLAAEMAHLPSEEEVQSAGNLIVAGLLEPPAIEDPYKIVFPAFMLAYVVYGNEANKQKLNDFLLPGMEDGEPGTTIMQAIVENMTLAVQDARASLTSASQDTTHIASPFAGWSRVLAAYLQLLCVWLYDSPLSVKAFLSESANLQVVSPPSVKFSACM